VPEPPGSQLQSGNAHLEAQVNAGGLGEGHQHWFSFLSTVGCDLFGF